MMGLPKWLRGNDGDLDMTRDDEVHVPPIAKVEPAMKKPLPFHIAPVDTPPNDDHAATVVAQAHSYIEQWKVERIAQQKTIDDLRIELTELALMLESERRKVAALELDLAEAHNNLQTQQSQIEEYRKFMSVWKEMNDRTRAVFDRFGIQAPPKKERKPNAKATKHPKKARADGTLPDDRKETNHPAEKPPAV